MSITTGSEPFSEYGSRRPVSDLASSFSTVSRAIAVVVALAGLSVLCGWQFDITTLKSIAPGLASMKANTAVCFMLCGFSLYILGSQRGQRSLRLNARIAAYMVLAIGGITVCEYAFDWNSGIDQLLFKDAATAGDTGNPGRMAPATAINFVAVGAALAILAANRNNAIVQCLALVAALSGALALTGYLYGVSALYRMASFSTVALHTAILFVLLAIAILFARPTTGLMRIVTSDSVAGALTRRLFPIVILMPALGWIRLAGERGGYYETAFGLALFVLVSIVILGSLILWTARSLDAVDRVRRQQESRLRESEERYRTLSETASDAMITIDEKSSIVFVNKAAEKVFGYESQEVVGHSLTILMPRYLRHVHQNSFSRYVETGEKHISWQGVALPGLHKTGREIPLELSFGEFSLGGKRYFTGIARDVTDRKHLEEQLRQSQKMDAIGRLAGGVAHDFNNLLTAIIGYCQLIRAQLATSSPLHRDLEEIEKAGERAASLTAQLLAFSRKQVLQPRILNLNEAIFGVEKMLRRLIGEDIDLVTTTSTDLGNVKADPGQIEQILVNLAVNSRDAMPEGGMLTIETTNIELDENYAGEHADVVPGRYVMLAVSDSGVGMDSQTLSRIFEPFFTTKEMGKGTGLGLAMVYGMVKQSGGHIWVYSEPGQGATFKVYFPRVEEVPIVTVQNAPVGESLAGSETILLVEDDAMVRKFARIALESYGYRILEAEDADAALRLSSQYDGLISIVVTDVVMPGMTGRNLGEQLAHSRPDMRVLYISGYTDNAILHHGVLDANTAFLQKPFTPEALARKVREVLDVK